MLRDYARLGLLLAHDGNWRGRYSQFQEMGALWSALVRQSDGDRP